jgi:peptidyl-prolyl cis-trans isomerase C
MTTNLKLEVISNQWKRNQKLTDYCPLIADYWSLSCLVAVLLLAPGCSKPVAKIDPNVLAKVGAVEIRVADFNREMELRLKANRTVLSKAELLDEMIQQELLLAKARQTGLENDPEFLRAQKVLLVSRYKERELRQQLDLPAIAATEVEARYQRTIDKYSRPAKARLAILYAKTEPKMSDEKRLGLRQKMDEARANSLQHRPDNRGFGPMAIEYSEDQASRYKGGDIGWLDQGRDSYRWPKEVLAAGFSLKANGDVSEIIEIPSSPSPLGGEGRGEVSHSSAGFYLVARLDWREGSVTPLSEVDSSIRRQLAVEKRREVEQNFLKKTREGVPVEIRSEALARVETPSIPVIATAKRTEPEPPAFP